MSREDWVSRGGSQFETEGPLNWTPKAGKDGPRGY